MAKPKVEHLVLVVMVGAILLFCVAAVYILLPFDPLTFNHLAVSQDRVCSGENVKIDADYNLNPAEFGSIRSMEIQTTWVSEDVPGIEPGRERVLSELTYDQDQLKPGQTIATGRAPRPAPDEPGVWRLKLRHTVRSIPHIQEVETYSENSTEVLSEDDPECIKPGAG